MVTLEVCANSVESCLEAQKGGAIRVELCDNLAEGGTTPSLSQIKHCIHSIDIQAYTIIRPRGGDFLYTDIEFEIMKADIHYCGQVGCDGVVFGILNGNGSIDKIRNKELVEIGHQYNMKCTFHRAFDRCQNLFESLEDAIELGFDRILTSGGKATACEGKSVIKQLIKTANNRIIIMPGGGITENNIAELVRETGLKEFHGSFRSAKKSRMEYQSLSFANEDEYESTDSKRVEHAITNANGIKNRD